MARQVKSTDFGQEWVYTTDTDLPAGKPIIGKFTRIRERCSSKSFRSNNSSSRCSGNLRSSCRNSSDSSNSSTSSTESRAPSTWTSGNTSSSVSACIGAGKKDTTSSPRTNTDIKNEEARRLEFEAQYEQLNLLGKGGFGSVYAGRRRADNVLVAIKHIPRDSILDDIVTVEGRVLPLEVAVMMKIGKGAAAAGGKSASISLLDFYDLDQELILILEHPDPCLDLFDYMGDKGGTLQEEETKNILKQMVKAVQELQVAGVFHRDIKTENILLETGTEVPRVRLIDFGLSCFAKEDSSFEILRGTEGQIHPEKYLSLPYRPEPATVWQLGIVLFEMLHERLFDTVGYFHKTLTIREDLSEDCKDILRLCLSLHAEQRPSLEQILQHPWLQ